MEFCITRFVIVALALWGAATLARAEQDIGLPQINGLYFTSGLEYASGDYGTGSTTKQWSLPLAVDYRHDRFSTGINTDLLYATSSGTIIIGGMNHMNSVTRSRSGESSVSGIGDINLYASYRLSSTNAGDISYYVTGRIKLGTADESKGLGSGENDYALEAGGRESFEKVSVYARLGYQITGDSATIDYRNVWYGNIGLTHPLNDTRSIGALLEFSQSATPGFDAPLQLSLYMHQFLSQQRQLYFYVMMGLSDGSPDGGVGVNLTYKL